MEHMDKSDTQNLISKQALFQKAHASLQPLGDVLSAASSDEAPRRLPSKRQHKKKRHASTSPSDITNAMPLPQFADRAVEVGAVGHGMFSKNWSKHDGKADDRNKFPDQTTLPQKNISYMSPIELTHGEASLNGNVIAKQQSSLVRNNARVEGSGAADQTPSSLPDVSVPQKPEGRLNAAMMTATVSHQNQTPAEHSFIVGVKEKSGNAAAKNYGSPGHSLMTKLKKKGAKMASNAHGSRATLGSDDEEQGNIVVNAKDVERNVVRRELGFLMTSDKKAALAHFVTSNFCSVQCSSYIPDLKKKAKAEEERKKSHAPSTELDKSADGKVMAPCCCGETFQWHVERGAVSAGGDEVDGARGAWLTGTNTKEVCTTAFGQISFVGFVGGDRRYLAPYVRISSQTQPRVVWDLLGKYWDLPGPKLLLSVTGGAKRFFTKNKETQIFKREFIDAVKATGAWVLTGGLGDGVMQYVGQAVHEYASTVGSMERHKLVLLGVCPWGAVNGREKLVDDKGTGLFPAKYNAADVKETSGTAVLDHNHTHFVFIDDGTVAKFGTEIGWRAKFEKYISMHIKTGVDREQSTHVPVVQLLINGGQNTLETAAEAVRNRTPLIVVDGTKRIADILAYAYRATKDFQWPSLDANSQTNKDSAASNAAAMKMLRNLTDKLSSMIQASNGRCLPEDIDNTLTILRSRELMTVFTLDNLNGEKSLDRIILQALMKAEKDNPDPKAQLSLALAWNKPEFARTEILTSPLYFKVFRNNNSLFDPLFRSLVNDQHQFVQLFIDCGVDLHAFLTPVRLNSLYKEVINLKEMDSQSELIQTLVDRATKTFQGAEKRKRHAHLLENVGKVITTLIGNYYPNEYKGRRFYELYAESLKMNGQGESVIEMDAAMMANDVPLQSGDASVVPHAAGRRRPNRPMRCPEKHLLLWAVLFNRPELAVMFWKSGINHMGTALIASRVAGKLSTLADNEDMDDLIAGYQQLSEKFEKLAVEVLCECYQRNKQLTYMCLTRKIHDLGNATAMSIAEDAEHEDFMQHMSCQLKLSRIWKGNMVMYTPEWKVILTAFLPFAFVPLLHFVRKRSDQPRADEKEFDDIAYMQPMDTSGTDVGGGANKASSSPVTRGDTVNFVEAHPSGGGGGIGGDDAIDRQQHGKYFSVSLMGHKPYTISYFSALHYFFTTPFTKFIYNVISYMTFLVIFSIFVLTELKYVNSASEIQVFECLTWIWCLSLILEEIRQVFSRTGTSFSYKLERWWSDDWNKMDVVMYLLFMTAVIIRFHLSPEHFQYAHMAYVVSLSFFIVRCSQMFFVYKQIGPKIIMIRRMLKDIFFFIFILSIFLFCYGIAYRALMYPNAQLNGSLLANIVFEPYFIIFGQVPLSEVYSPSSFSSCNSNLTSSQYFGPDDACPTTNWLAPIYLALYCLVANILLINLLIAMFSFTFQSVQEHAERLWKYNRYSLIYEFFDRPAAPVPFIVLEHIYRLFVHFTQNCKLTKTAIHHDFQITLTKEDTQRVIAFERVAMESYMTVISKEENDDINTKVATTSTRMEKVMEDIDDIKENLTELFSGMKEGDSSRLLSGDLEQSMLFQEGGIESAITRKQSGHLPQQTTYDAYAGTPGLSLVMEDIVAMRERLRAVESTMEQKFDALTSQLFSQHEVMLQMMARLEGVGGNSSMAPCAVASSLTPLDPT